MDATPRRTEPGAPDAADASVSPSELLVEQLGLLDRITAHVCRRRRLTADEAEEFAGHVRLRFVEDDYAILRSFRHRCSLGTYLHIVIERLLLDYRTAQWGRWRPSVRAAEMGDVGVLLERLMTRDGLSFDDACSVMQTNHKVDVSPSDLYAMSVKLPVRRRRRFVSETFETSLATDGRPDDNLTREDAGRVAAQLKTALRASITELTPADRALLDMRYRQGRPVADIARALNAPAKPLYRRLEQIVRRLRRPVQAVAARLAGANADVFRVGDVTISW